MIKQYLLLVLSILSITRAIAEYPAALMDTIPDCTGNYLFDSENFNISLFEFDSIIEFKEELGYFNWGPSSSNFAMLNNIYEGDKLTLIAFDTAGYLVYSKPIAENGWFASTRTDVKFTSNYKTVAAYDEMIYIYQSNRLFKYRLGGDLQLLRTDVVSSISQQVMDEDYNYVYLSDSPDQGFRADAVQIVDSLGVINYRFAFSPLLNTYNMQSMFMMNDSLFVITGSLNQAYDCALVYIKLDYSTYTAEPIPIYYSCSVGNLVHIVSCSPGKIAEGCAPNVHIEPDITSVADVPERPVRISPNPVDSELTILMKANTPVHFDIYDSHAQRVMHGVTDGYSGTIDVEALPVGMYFIRLKDSWDSAAFAIEKFIKAN